MFRFKGSGLSPVLGVAMEMERSVRLADESITVVVVVDVATDAVAVASMDRGAYSPAFSSLGA